METARVRAGSSQRNSAGVIYGVNTISIHPDYADDAERDADIAVVRLARAVDFTDKIQAGILYTANSVIPDNAEVTVVGWGNTGVSDKIVLDIDREKHNSFISNTHRKQRKHT